jgi:hypothetical protein
MGRDLPPYVSATRRRGPNPLLWPAYLLEHVTARQQGYFVALACFVLIAIGLESVTLVLVGLWLVQVVVGLVGIFFTK